MAATILHLQRLSTEDGPGIRTTVFLKGCSLRCAWCHNPESLSPRPQVHWLENRCIGCRSCLNACPNGGLSMPDGHGLVIDRAKCQGCGECAKTCPSGALEALGRTTEVEELSRELLKDLAYYRSSGGGVTLSGGEPALQAEFCAVLLARLKSAGVHTALDTCGQCPRSALEALLPHTDLILYDLKLLDPALHARWTGQPNRLILENLAWLGSLRRERAYDFELWVRTPLIPGATACAENLGSIGAWLARQLSGLVTRWELCAFNNLCRDKYLRLGLEWEFASTPLLSSAELDDLAGAARSALSDPAILHVSGPSRGSTPAGP